METINLIQAMAFFKNDHFVEYKKKFAGSEMVGKIIRSYKDEYPENFKAIIEAPIPDELLPTHVKPEEPETPFEKVIGRMYNWKQTSAYNYAKDIPDFPDKALTKLKTLSDKFGNCGWQEGEIYNELRDTNFEIADILGYEYDETQDVFSIKNIFTKK